MAGKARAAPVCPTIELDADRRGIQAEKPHRNNPVLPGTGHRAAGGCEMRQ